MSSKHSPASGTRQFKPRANDAKIVADFSQTPIGNDFTRIKHDSERPFTIVAATPECRQFDCYLCLFDGVSAGTPRDGLFSKILEPPKREKRTVVVRIRDRGSFSYVHSFGAWCQRITALEPSRDCPAIPPAHSKSGAGGLCTAESLHRTPLQPRLPAPGSSDGRLRGIHPFRVVV